MDRLSELREPGPTISKFFTYNENSIQAMSEPYLWFSTLDAFNDPFEGAIELESTGEPMEWLNVAQMIEKRYPGDSGYALMAAAMRQSWSSGGFETREIFTNHLKKRFIERSKAYGYCCLVNDHEIVDESDILMWGHYGNGLKGFKVIFDSKMLIASLPTDIARAPILYGKSIPTLDILQHSRASAGAMQDGEKAKAVLDATTHIRTKHHAWSYEKEYRFISPTPGAHKFASSSIKQVVFGEKMPASQRKVLSSVLTANSPDIVFLTAKVSKGSYDLIIE